MVKSKLLNIFALLLLALFLSACASTTKVEFEPAEEQEPDTVSYETPDAPPAEPSELSEVLPEVKPYSTDIAGTAEQLYGDDIGGSANIAYSEAAAADPMLQYTIIYFDFNRSEVKADAREILSHHASFMAARPDAKLRIEGHADQRGTSGYNLALGESRADAVRTILAAYGVDRSRISVISFGEEQPAIDGNTEEAFRLNRRAELIYF